MPVLPQVRRKITRERLLTLDSNVQRIKQEVLKQPHLRLYYVLLEGESESGVIGYNSGGTVYLNINYGPFYSPDAKKLFGTIVHELSHDYSGGHDINFIHAQERLFLMYMHSFCALFR